MQCSAGGPIVLLFFVVMVIILLPRYNFVLHNAGDGIVFGVLMVFIIIIKT